MLVLARLASLRGLTLVLTVCSLCSSTAIASDWPSFRGPKASGIAEGAHPPASWNGETGENIRWRVAIPGLGHSSPIVVGDKVFVTTAVGQNPNPTLRVGLYGESPEHPEDEVFQYKLLCFNKKDGKLLWEQLAHKGKPQVKRHIKSSHANSTAASDGKVVLAFFGSEGLYCYSTEGKLLWSKNFGYLNSGAFNAHEIQWGFGNSPTIHQDMAIILCDANNTSFLTALNLKDGSEIWRTPRDENATWCTPTVVEHKGRTQIIVNGFKHIGGYDLKTGQEIWKLKGGGDIPVPTAVVAKDMVYITNAHGPLSPIYAISLDATGDITLAEGQTSNQYVVWSHPRNGAYMPTPLVYDDYIYVPNNQGILTCCNAKTGEVLYRERIASQRGSYSSSPVAADGKLYFTDEEGNIHVVKAGPKYEFLGTFPIDGLCLATPAIADDMLFVRTSKELVGVGDTHGKILVAGPAKKPTMEAAPAPKAEALEPLDPSNPVSILKHVDAAARAANLVRYSVKSEGREALAGQGTVEMTVTAQDYQDGLPKYFKIDGSLKHPAFPLALNFSCGSDGTKFYASKASDPALHEDIEFRVLGGAMNAYRSGVFVEFQHDQPFSDEINANSVELKGSTSIEGVDCWEIKVAFAQTPDNHTTWYFAKSDLLPRARLDEFQLENGQAAGTYKVISKFELAPNLAPDWYALPKAETKTSEPLSIP